MKHFPVPSLYGIVKDYPARFIPENKCQDGLNVMFKQGRVRSRWGYSQVGSALNGEVKAIAQFDLLRTQVKYTVAITTTDAYYWSTASAGSWKYITKSYNTGTVTLKGGDATVTGTATTWAGLTGTAASWKIGFYKADGTTTTNDINLVGTWYDIASITDGSHLEMSAAWSGTATTAGLSYVIRQCFSGDDTNDFSVAFPYDDDVPEKILVATNGKDPIVKWTGTGVMTDLGGATGVAARYIGYFGAVGYEHTYLAWVTDEGTNYPQTIVASEVGDPELWTTWAFDDLLTTEDEIKGLVSLGTQLIVYKSRSITEAWATGGSTSVLDYNQNKIKNIGTPTIKTVCDFGSFHIFMGWDNIYMFDGIQAIPIGTEIINTMLAEMNRDEIEKCFALNIREENLYCLFIPTLQSYCDKAYVYNHVEKTWTIWTLNREDGTVGLLTCGGISYEETALSWDELEDIGTTWANMEGQWDDQISFSDSIYLIGDKDGKVYKFNQQYTTDAGSDFTATITTRDYPLNDAKHAVRLNELVLGLLEQSEGDIQVRCSVDFGANWSDWITLSIIESPTSPAVYFEQIANFIERGKQVRFQIENVDGSYFELESLIIGYNDAGIVN